MKNLLYLVPVFLLIVFISKSDYIYSALTEQGQPERNNESQLLADNCFQKWKTYDWTLGDSGALAVNHAGFTNGIKNICRAKAELFFEGYKLNPFVLPDSQAEIFPIVFLSSYDEIKNQIRQNLPKLQLI
ncbi:MAG TPA: hypothetical protein ENH74_03975 [Methylophaga sp.]|nr:hypothetical protein [Methylophaga sp.]